jgi:thiosulfate dehydrogenase [quinone] large subunit
MEIEIHFLNKGCMVMMNWLRNNVYASGLLLVLRLYLGWEWLSAGWHKLAGPKPFDAAGFLKKIVSTPVVGSDKSVLYPTYNSFIEGFALPNVKLFNFLIPWGEFLVGLGLILGVLTTAAMFFGLTMNFMFMFGGTVSSNPWMVLLGFIVLAAGLNAGKFGVDRWLIPWLRQSAKRWFKKGGGISA